MSEVIKYWPNKNFNKSMLFHWIEWQSKAVDSDSPHKHILLAISMYPRLNFSFDSLKFVIPPGTMPRRRKLIETETEETAHTTRFKPFFPNLDESLPVFGADKMPGHKVFIYHGKVYYSGWINDYIKKICNQELSK